MSERCEEDGCDEPATYHDIDHHWCTGHLVANSNSVKEEPTAAEAACTTTDGHHFYRCVICEAVMDTPLAGLLEVPREEPEADAVAAAREQVRFWFSVHAASAKQAEIDLDALIAAARPPREAGCLEPQPDGTPCIIRHTQDSDINHFSDAALAGTLDDLDERVAELEAALESLGRGMMASPEKGRAYKRIPDWLDDIHRVLAPECRGRR